MLDTPLRFVVINFAAKAHLPRGRLGLYITVLLSTEKSFLQELHRNEAGLRVGLTLITVAISSEENLTASTSDRSTR